MYKRTEGYEVSVVNQLGNSAPGFTSDVKPQKEEEANENNIKHLVGHSSPRTFISEVSVAGLKYVFLQSANYIRRLFWLSLVLFGVVVAGYQIYDRVVYFTGRPTSVNYKVVYNESITFPTVTICNQNIFNKSRINATDPDLLKALQIITPPADIPGIPKGNYTLAQELGGKYATDGLDWEALYQSWAVDLNATIIVASFDSEVYFSSAVFKRVMTGSGPCFQFNSDGALKTFSAGMIHGLSVYLYVDQHNYFFSNTPTAGFLVTLHDKWVKPNTPGLSFVVPSGGSTVAGISYRQVQHLPAPYSDCLENGVDDSHYCVDKCLSDFVSSPEQCGCRSYLEPGDAPVCGPFNTNCLYVSYATIPYEYIRANCSCPRKCLQRYYDYSISTSRWSESSKQYLYGVFGITPEEMELNVAKLDVFLNTMEYEETKVVPAYSFTSFLCDIGGALGLILGSTVLTFFEVGDFLIVNAWVACANYRHKNKNPLEIKRKQPKNSISSI